MPTERRSSGDRRERLEDGEQPERRASHRRQSSGATPVERRSGDERRNGKERRTKLERRGRETPEEHVRNALQLLANVAESGVLTDELQRDLDSAMFRLRFAVDRLENEE